MEGDLARIKDVMAAAEEDRVVAKEARHKAESKATRLDFDRTSPAKAWDSQG